MIKSKSRSGPIEIDLTGPNGNAFFLLGSAKMWTKQLNEAGAELDWKAIEADATSGDYEHLLSVMEKHFGHYVTFLR